VARSSITTPACTGLQLSAGVQTFPAVPGLRTFMEDSASTVPPSFACRAGARTLEGFRLHLSPASCCPQCGPPYCPPVARIVRGVVTSPATGFTPILVLPTCSGPHGPASLAPDDEPAAVVCLIAPVFSSNTSVKKMQETSLKLTVPARSATTLFSLAVAFKVSNYCVCLVAWCLGFAGFGC